MHDAYSSDDSRCLQELHEEALKAIYSAGFDIQSNNPENIEKAPNIDNGLEAVFPPFSYSDFPLENILSTKQQSAMTILPYLLSSYYISLHRRQKLGSSPELEIFPRTDNIPLLKGDHFSRNLNVFLSRFSSRGFLFRLIKKELQNPKLKEFDISDKDIELAHKKYIEILRKGPVGKMHYVQLYKAFIYFSCAAICASNLSSENNFKVDYKKSWKLFGFHTCAFEPIHLTERLQPDFDEAETDTNVTIGYDIFSSPYNSVSEEYYKDCMNHLAAHEVYLRKSYGTSESSYDHRLIFKPAKLGCAVKTEQDAYINQAMICSVLANPLVHPHLWSSEALIRNLLCAPKTSQEGKAYFMPYL